MQKLKIECKISRNNSKTLKCNALYKHKNAKNNCDLINTSNLLNNFILQQLLL